VIARSERGDALVLALVYLGFGYLAWWTSPTTDPVSGTMPTVGPSMLGLWATTALLAGFALMPWRDRIITWLPPAVIGPLALAPLTLHPGDWPSLVIAALWPAAVAPLGQALASDRSGRVLSLSAVAVAIVLGLAVAVRWWGQTNEFAILRYGAIIAIVALPALGRLRSGGPVGDLSPTRITERGLIAVAVVAPSLAGLVLTTSWEAGAAVLVTALAATAAAAWIAVRPLAWMVAREGARREAAIAANEAERRRLAADLHDGPLQDVLLLARRLDDTGDTEGAALARGIATDLRELSGDLRLPMLDDLGVGPSLEWLAGRVRRATALDVRAEVSGAARPPPPVELAAFRIAQEAVANAVRHGAPPIVVRCRTAAASLQMTVTDAGGWRSPTTAEDSPAVAGLGLSTMRQRAQQIGADLSWARNAVGGTVVSLDWDGQGA
jgi:signal transduction histidine kinase